MKVNGKMDYQTVKESLTDLMVEKSKGSFFRESMLRAWTRNFWKKKEKSSNINENVND